MAEVPETVREFVHACLDSVEQLEVLALLQENPEKTWTIAALSQELRSTEHSVEKRLANLVARKVLRPLGGPSFRYEPSSPAVHQAVAECVSYYRARPFRVMELLFSQPSSAIRSFADAFRWKKEDE